MAHLRHEFLGHDDQEVGRTLQPGNTGRPRAIATSTYSSKYGPKLTTSVRNMTNRTANAVLQTASKSQSSATKSSISSPARCYMDESRKSVNSRVRVILSKRCRGFAPRRRRHSAEASCNPTVSERLKKRKLWSGVFTRTWSARAPANSQSTSPCRARVRLALWCTLKIVARVGSSGPSTIFLFWQGGVVNYC